MLTTVHTKKNFAIVVIRKGSKNFPSPALSTKKQTRLLLHAFTINLYALTLSGFL